MEKLGVAFIGCGAISKTHLNAIKKIPNASLKAIVDTDSKALKNFQTYLDTEIKSVADHKILLNDNSIDVVHILTPHYSHPEIALDFFKAGKHLVLEKPIAHTYNNSSTLVELSKKYNSKCTLVYQNRLNPEIQYLKKILEESKYGKILGLKGIVTWSRGNDYYNSSPWKGTWDKEGGGVLINQSIHTLDLMLWLGGDISSFEGSIHKHKLKHIQVEDTAEIFIEFKNGARGVFYATNNYSYDAGVELEVHCEKGVLNIKNNILRCFMNGQEEILLDGREETESKACYGNSHFRLIDNFYQYLSNGEGSYIAMEEGLKALEIIDFLYKS